ncbi:MAG: hypothetical protein FWH40_04060 [Coriobacteriia bacterium]|nr:hypothetical protein [Coriobacteriia bacterium]
MNWWEEQDWIDPDQWLMSGIEIKGTTPSMFWVINVQTHEKGLFKPDSNWRRSAFSEYAASKIAAALDIPCARIEVGNIFGAGGCISIDVRDGYQGHILAADNLSRCQGLLNYDESDDANAVYSKPGEMSFMGLLPYLPRQAEQGLIQMMFFDAIIGNFGRHLSNFYFTINAQRAITGLLPLFDQGNAMLSEASRQGGRGRGYWGWGGQDGSAFPYYGQGGMHRPFPFVDMFECMWEDYPDLLNELFLRARTARFEKVLNDFDCYNVVMERIDKYQRH